MSEEKKKAELFKAIRNVVNIIGAVLIIIESIESLRKREC